MTPIRPQEVVSTFSSPRPSLLLCRVQGSNSFVSDEPLDVQRGVLLLLDPVAPTRSRNPRCCFPSLNRASFDLQSLMTIPPPGHLLYPSSPTCLCSSSHSTVLQHKHTPLLGVEVCTSSYPLFRPCDLVSANHLPEPESPNEESSSLGKWGTKERYGGRPPWLTELVKEDHINRDFRSLPSSLLRKGSSSGLENHCFRPSPLSLVSSRPEGRRGTVQESGGGGVVGNQISLGSLSLFPVRLQK